MQKAEHSEVKDLDFTQRASKGESSTSSGGKVKDADLRSIILRILFFILESRKENPVNPGF